MPKSNRNVGRRVLARKSCCCISRCRHRAHPQLAGTPRGQFARAFPSATRFIALRNVAVLASRRLAAAGVALGLPALARRHHGATAAAKLATLGRQAAHDAVAVGDDVAAQPHDVGRAEFRRIGRLGLRGRGAGRCAHQRRGSGDKQNPRASPKSVVHDPPRYAVFAPASLCRRIVIILGSQRLHQPDCARCAQNIGLWPHICSGAGTGATSQGRATLQRVTISFRSDSSG
jgi:hypothetical protein